MYKDLVTAYHTTVYNIEELEAVNTGLKLCSHWMNADSLLPLLEPPSTATPTSIPTTVQPARKPRLKLVRATKSNNQDKRLGFSLLKDSFLLLCSFSLKPRLTCTGP